MWIELMWSTIWHMPGKRQVFYFISTFNRAHLPGFYVIRFFWLADRHEDDFNAWDWLQTEWCARQTDKQTNRQTNKQTNRQTNNNSGGSVFAAVHSIYLLATPWTPIYVMSSSAAHSLYNKQFQTIYNKNIDFGKNEKPLFL